MKNLEKYATIDERAKAFQRFCSCKCNECRLQPYKNTLSGCEYAWLELEADEAKLLPCPFCGSKVVISERIVANDVVRFALYCTANECEYRSGRMTNVPDAIAAHNRVCKAVSNCDEKGEPK